MGLFDFFKKQNKEELPLEPSENLEEKDSSKEEVKFQKRLTARSIGADDELILKIVQKMVEEDPFQNFYSRKSDADILRSDRKFYEYAEVTTMNASLTEDLRLTIEGIFLEKLPERIAAELAPYQQGSLLIIYVFILGGKYKKRSEQSDQLEEGTVPYDLEINLQYT